LITKKSGTNISSPYHTPSVGSRAKNRLKRAWREFCESIRIGLRKKTKGFGERDKPHEDER
jgi:hypothetical protein